MDFVKPLSEARSLERIAGKGLKELSVDGHVTGAFKGFLSVFGCYF